QDGEASVGRNIILGPGTSTIEIRRAAGFLDLTGNISGEGALRFDGSGSVRISDASGLNGVIRTSGRLRLAPNAQIGSGGLELNVGSMVTLDGPFSTNSKGGLLHLGGFPDTVQFDTNGFDAVLNGGLSGGTTQVILLKRGAGTLSVTNGTGYN